MYTNTRAILMCQLIMSCTHGPGDRVYKLKKTAATSHLQNEELHETWAKAAAYSVFEKLQSKQTKHKTHVTAQSLQPGNVSQSKGAANKYILKSCLIFILTWAEIRIDNSVEEPLGAKLTKSTVIDIFVSKLKFRNINLQNLHLMHCR